MLGGNLRRRIQSTARFNRSPRIRHQLVYRWLRGRRLWWVAGVLLVALIGIVTWLVWPSPAEPEPRARQYRDVTACLLTDERGVTGARAAPVWAGMQDASLTTLAKVQFLEVDGPQTANNAQTYLASLVQSKCDLILAVGEAQVAALAATAPRYPSIRFVAVGSTTAGVNVSVVEEKAPNEVRNKVGALVRAAVGPKPSS